MKPMKNPPPVNMLSMENMRTKIPPVLTLPGSSEFIIIDPIITMIPNTNATTPISTRNPPIGIKPIIVKPAPNMPNNAAITIPFISINIPPIRDRTKAAVGFSTLDMLTITVMKYL